MPIRAKLYSMMAEELGSLNDSGGSTVGSLARTSQIITWGVNVFVVNVCVEVVFV